MSSPRSSVPLNFPLNFTYTEKAHSKKLSALLIQGDYHAIEKREYDGFQRCHGCGTDEKAKKLVLVQDRVTGEVFEIGRVCMRDLYGVDLEQLDQHAAAVNKSRRSLEQKLRLTGDLPVSRMIEILRETLFAYTPLPERFLPRLGEMDDFILSNDDSDWLRDLMLLAYYHREWVESPERARRRWTALELHPAFLGGPVEQTIKKICRRALHEQRSLPDQEIFRLNGWLRSAAGYHSRTLRLVDPVDFPSADVYQAALRQALLSRMTSGTVEAQLSEDNQLQTLGPLNYVRPEGKATYAQVAIWTYAADDFATRIQQTRSYFQKGYRPMVEIGPEQVEQVPATIRQFRNRDNELEDRVIRPAWVFHFRLVAWTLAEPYHPVFKMWRDHGRASLEGYQ